jgi:hypothetical protein
VGAAPTKPGRASTARWGGSGERDAEVYVRNRRLRPLMGYRLEIWRIWAGRGAYPSTLVGGELAGGFESACPGGHGESPRRSRGEAAGTQSGAYCDERSTVNTGTAQSWFPPGGWPARRVG